MADDDFDLEEELLAVAGRSRPAASNKRSRRAASSDDDASGEDDRGGRGRGPKRNSVPSRKRPAAVQGVEATDDSDFDDGYGSDLMGDARDRAELNAMNELEREMILAERSEARDREKERRRNARLVRQRTKDASQAANMRSSTRMKAADNAKKSAMAELVAAKNARNRKTKRQRKARKDEEGWSEDEVLSESDDALSERSSRQRTPDQGSLGSDDEPIERDWDRRRDDRSDDDDDIRRRSSEEPEDAEDAAYEDILKIQVRRILLEKWVNEPFFERTLPGTVVRVAMRGQYFMAEVIEVIEREEGTYRDAGVPTPCPYPLDRAGETRKWLVVQRGTSSRTMPMTLISNHHIEEDEFESWQRQCERDRRPQITLPEVDAVKARLKEAQSYVYTSSDVQKIIEEKRAKGSLRHAAAERARLIALRDAAQETGNFEEAELLDAQLAEIQARMAGASRGVDSRSFGMAHVNKKNALRNMENALRNVTSRPEGSRALTAEGVDPFSRRQTRPMNYWSTKRKTDEGVGQDTAAVVEGTSGADAPIATARENEAGGIDLNIDLSVLDVAPKSSLLVKRLLGSHWGTAQMFMQQQQLAGKKTLTLTDYKRRQGIA